MVAQTSLPHIFGDALDNFAAAGATSARDGKEDERALVSVCMRRST